MQHFVTVTAEVSKKKKVENTKRTLAIRIPIRQFLQNSERDNHHGDSFHVAEISLSSIHA